MIYTVGDASIDHYVTTGERHVGGIATNFAVHASRLGAKTTLITAIGNDDDAKFFLKQMRLEGVDTTHVQQLPGQTSEQKIRLVGKERNFCGFFTGVLTDMELTKKDLALLKNEEAVVVPLTDGLKKVFEQVMHAELGSTLKIVDFSRDADIEGFSHGDVAAMVFHYLEYLDIAFIGGDESIIDTIHSIADANPNKILITTLGPKGSIAYYGGKEYKQKAFWMKNIVDTTGCGDAFRSGFTTSYLENKDIDKALERGAQLAADAATHFGAF